jgi:hypothetical protein
MGHFLTYDALYKLAKAGKCHLKRISLPSARMNLIRSTLRALSSKTNGSFGPLNFL